MSVDATSGATQSFQDPVTYELMADPVVCDDGHTYDRKTAAKLGKSPFTRAPLKILVDNVDLRGAIFECHPDLARAYREQKVRLEHRLVRPKSVGSPPSTNTRPNPPMVPQEGNGCWNYAGGDIYEGPFHKGLAHGRGRYTWASGATYVGDFKDGRFEGTGRHDDPDGTYYEGQYARDQPNGHGFRTYADGSFYEGEFKDGQCEGKGQTSWPGYCYEGSFKSGLRHGWGIEVRDGVRHRTLFENGKVLKTVTYME